MKNNTLRERIKEAWLILRGKTTFQQIKNEGLQKGIEERQKLFEDLQKVEETLIPMLKNLYAPEWKRNNMLANDYQPMVVKLVDTHIGYLSSLPLTEVLFQKQRVETKLMVYKNLGERLDMLRKAAVRQLSQYLAENDFIKYDLTAPSPYDKNDIMVTFYINVYNETDK